MTDPVQVSKDEVRKDLHDDIYEKKLALAMSQYFQQLKDAAQIDNYLAGTVHQPTKKPAAGTAPGKTDVSAKTDGSRSGAPGPVQPAAAHLPTLQRVPAQKR